MKNLKNKISENIEYNNPGVFFFYARRIKIELNEQTIIKFGKLIEQRIFGDFTEIKNGKSKE